MEIEQDESTKKHNYVNSCGHINISGSPSGTKRVTRVKNPMINHEGD